MLKTRVITALVIAALLIPAIFFLDAQNWALLTAAITGIAAWEFARLASFSKAAQIGFGVMVGMLAAGAALLLDAAQLKVFGTVALYLSVAFWLAVVPFWLRARWEVRAVWKMLLVGLVVLLPTWFALIAVRGHGPVWLFGALLLVALADIAAYFFGRAFGKRKLAPNISPGKTWEGAYGAMFSVTLLALVAMWSSEGFSIDRTVFLLVAMPLLTLVSIAGDLFESMLKRQAGMKDSSQLLPGHGGVLDRIDSHTAALPLIALLLAALG
ncbi:phosphatidate cytidylyltransferase [Azonexus sp. IMCC34839]|uniref:phosphatidate cytidylyltransferase n=1 Tax=Azonexus sp. IMCC34839 TaxID=3133695 RepID=UPI003999593F